jgi:hypothetical protein
VSCDDIFPVNLDPFGSSLDPRLNTDGSNCMIGPLKITFGNAASPGIQFCDEPQTGMYLKSSSELCFSVLASTVLCVNPIGIDINVGGFKATVTHENTEDHIYTLQDKDCVVACLSDVGSGPGFDWYGWSCGW